jgi:hypothetical protein
MFKIGNAFAAVLTITPVLAGCMSPPPLDDANLGWAGVASTADLVRYRQAKDSFRSRYHLPLTASTVNWPVIRVSFQTSRELFNLNEMAQVGVSSCDGDKVATVGSADILWKSRMITPVEVREIDSALKTGPQEYEVFFSYETWKHDQAWKPGDPIRLQPLSSDLCVSMTSWDNWPLEGPGPYRGRSLRISRELVNAAIAPFLDKNF